MTSRFEERSRPHNWAVELGDVRSLTASASQSIAEGEFNTALELARKAVEATSSPLQELEASATPAEFFWQLERIRALTCALSAQISLGNQERASSLGAQLQWAYGNLNFDSILTFSEGVCCHGNWSPTGDCQSVPPCTIPLC
jgi:hypothetical protein